MKASARAAENARRTAHEALKEWIDEMGDDSEEEGFDAAALAARAAAEAESDDSDCVMTAPAVRWPPGPVATQEQHHAFPQAPAGCVIWALRGGKRRGNGSDIAGVSQSLATRAQCSCLWRPTRVASAWMLGKPLLLHRELRFAPACSSVEINKRQRLRARVSACGAIAPMTNAPYHQYAPQRAAAAAVYASATPPVNVDSPQRMQPSRRHRRYPSHSDPVHLLTRRLMAALTKRLRCWLLSCSWSMRLTAPHHRLAMRTWRCSTVRLLLSLRRSSLCSMGSQSSRRYARPAWTLLCWAAC
jgi:hypothetical protein